MTAQGSLNAETAAMTAAESNVDLSALAIDPVTFRALGYRAVDMATDYLAGMRERPVFTPMSPDERQNLLEQALPDDGAPPDEILDRFAELILPHPMGNGHPRFFGWVNSPPSPIGALAEFLAGAMGPSCAGGDHAATYLERCAVRWLMELVGFPTDGSMSILVSGGSMASLTALAAARQRAAQQDGRDVRRDGLPGWGRQLTMYMSSEAHTTLKKAAELLGIGSEAVRIIPADDNFRLDVTGLRQAIDADRDAGMRPFCVVASAGTVSTGAIDPFNDIADLCEEEGLWLHVDGAYGAVGVLDPDKAPRFAGMERADSLALDPHKWLSVPVECGCALIRDGALLRDTFSLVPPYVRTEEGKGFGGLPWFAEYGFQQTRGFRALKLWMTLLHAGRDGLAAMISRHNALARHLAALIDEAPDLERAAPVELSIVCFRYVPPDVDLSDEQLDALNKAIMEEVQAGGEVFLTQALLHGRFVLRANVLHYETTAEDVAALVAVVRKVGKRLT
jgi:aromatic-L-amino-acid decarboxylase